jgi:cytochrome bd-type quinol oxidase subunit 2
MHWLYRPENRRPIWIAFAIVLLATVVAGFMVDMHPHFAFESWPAFFAIYGFLACVVLIFGAKLLGLLLRRPDTYYDR